MPMSAFRTRGARGPRAGSAAVIPWGLLLAATGPAAAAVPDGPPPALAHAWSPTPWSLVPLVALTAGFVLASRGGRVGRVRTGAFVAGLLALILALVWPVDAYVAYALSAHVAQHMLLLAIAPPLLVFGLTPTWTARAPPRLRTTIERGLGGRLGAATLAHVAVLWVWHLPAVTTAALASEPVHRAMLATVLLAGLWFWAAVLQRAGSRDGGIAGALVALVTAMMLMGFLGALLTFSPRLLYPAYTDRAVLAGLDALADQQLGGLLMWVPGGLPYLVVGLCLAVVLVRDLQRRAAA